MTTLTKGPLPPATALLCLLLSAGCRSSSTPLPATSPGRGSLPAAVPPGMSKPGAAARLDPALLKPPTEPTRLGPGDVLEIELIGAPEGPQRTFVGPDGKIYFNLLSGLQVWGYTLDETRRALEQALTAFLQNPRISVTLREVHSRRVQVMGRVSVPGLYDLGEPMTILDAISQARGLYTSRAGGASEEMADLKHSFLIRKGQVVPVNFERLIREGDTSQNIYLDADDLVLLTSTSGSQFYVLGAVNQPRAVPYKGQTTLISAIAACRGLSSDAKPKHIAIVRGSLQDPSLAVIDMAAILKGQQPDILLSPQDIIYVPSRSPVSLRGYLDLVITTFARSIAANEAARVTGSDTPVGLSLGGS